MSWSVNQNNIKQKFLAHKKKIMLLFVLCVGFGIYKYFIQSKSSYNEEKTVEAIAVKKSRIRQTANFIGTIKSSQQTTLVAKTKGILNIQAKPGQFMQKGELIAKIDNKDIEHNYEILKEAEEVARLQFDRSTALHKSGVLSKHAVEEKKSALLEYRKKLSDAKISLEELKIHAPFDGVVGLFKFREGSQVNSGDMIVAFYNPHSLIVDFDVPLSVAKQVEDGRPVFINGKKYKLTHIQKMLDEETHMCPAYVEIKCSDCIVGTTVDVRLVVKEVQSVIVIPYEAVFLREGSPFVYVVKENKAVLTPVELGIREKKSIAIVSGLEEGEQLIAKRPDRLYPEAFVKPILQKKRSKN